jgi:undecaprenyl-diphosphatase
MDFIPLLQALIIGIVEGLTEFLPVSSTGHMIIVGEAISFSDERSKVFEIFIQLGAILAVVWLYRARVFGLVHVNRPTEQRLLLNLLIAFLPAAALGFFAHGYIKEYLFNPKTVAWALIVGGFAILVIEKWYAQRAEHTRTLDDMSPAEAFKVGMAQTISLFPGVSRAGATIMGGMVGGLSRTTATEFSFFLAIPTMFAAVLYDLYKNMHLLFVEDATIFAIGFITAFVTAFVVIKTFLVYVSRHTFRVFAWYRIVFGAVVLAYFW